MDCRVGRENGAKDTKNESTKLSLKNRDYFLKFCIKDCVGIKPPTHGHKISQNIYSQSLRMNRNKSLSVHKTIIYKIP